MSAGKRKADENPILDVWDARDIKFEHWRLGPGRGSIRFTHH